MATVGPQNNLDLWLPLHVEPTGPGFIGKDGLERIVKNFKDDLAAFNCKYKLPEHRKLRDIDFRDSKIVILFHIPVFKKDELAEMHQKIKEDCKKLSEFIREFSFHQGWHLLTNLKPEARLKCEIDVPESSFSHQLDLYEEWKTTVKESTYTNSNANDTKVANDSISSGTFKVTGSAENTSAKHLDASCKVNANNQTPVLKKTFILYVQPQARHVLDVWLSSEQCKEIHLNKLESDENFYLASVEIKADRVFNDTLVYNVKYKGKYRNTTITEAVQVQDLSIQRDVFNGNSLKVNTNEWWEMKIQGTSAHLINILSNANKTTDISEACMEIEKLCNLKFIEHEVVYIVNQILKLLPWFEEMEKQNLLFGVIIGNLFCNNSKKFELRKVIDENKANVIIKNLQNFSLHMLPSSCQSYMPNVYLELYKIAMRERYSILTYLNNLYHFLGEHYVLTKIQSIVKPNITTEFENNSETLAKDLCLKAYKSGSKTAIDIICILLRNLPMQDALNTFGILSTMDDNVKNDVQTAIYSAIVIRVEAILTNALKSQKLQVILDTWLHVRHIHAMKEKFLKKIEDALLMLLSTNVPFTENVCEIIISLIEKHGFYSEPTKQRELLEKIAKSPIESVNKLFISLTQCTQIRDQYLKLESELFEEFYLNNLAARSRAVANDVRSRMAFEILSGLWHLPFLNEHPQLKEFICKKYLEELDKCTMTYLLKQLPFFEGLFQEIIRFQELFLDHIRVSNEMNLSQNPHQILLEMSGNHHGSITRIQSEIICILMEIHGDGLLEKKELWDQFFYLVPKAQFWILISHVKGRNTEIIKQNKKYRIATACIKEFTKLFLEDDANYNIIQKLDSELYSEGAKKLMMLPNNTKLVIDKKLSDYQRIFNNEKDMLVSTEQVLLCIQTKSNIIEVIFCEILNRINQAKDDIISGKVSLKECMRKKRLWNNIEELPKVCQQLKPLVTSQVFWNLWKGESYEQFLKNTTVSEEIDEDPIFSITKLFNELSLPEEPLENEIQNAKQYLDFLLLTGNHLYKDAWSRIQDDASIKMIEIHFMFGSIVNIQEEIKSAETILRLNIPLSTQKALERIYAISNVKDSVVAMISAAKAFDIDIALDDKISSAIESFENLLKDNVNEYSFADVKKALNTVFVIADSLSEETMSIMSNLGKSQSLITFLKRIVDDDIRNLIDAVEDISEQQVQESTVSALIEIKSFFHPLLIADFEGNCSELFHLLEKQTKSISGRSSSLPDKIEECMRNLHNLKSLYNNVANRSEQTNEIIQNIIKKGKFHFKYDTAMNVVKFEVTYKQHERKEIKQKTTVIDLRSRALLLMNTDREQDTGAKRFNQEDLIKFVEYVDVGLDIEDTLFKLHSLGHIEFMNINVTKRTTDLQNAKEEFSSILCSWQNDLQCEQRIHFLMNYIYGNQIHTLYRFLDKGKEDKRTVQTILAFIHPKLNADIVKPHYLEEKQKQPHWSNAVMLHCLGYSLHVAYTDLEVFQRPLIIPEGALKRITDTVKRGKMLLAQLEEGSLYTVKTVLALYSNTTQNLPEPHQLLFCTKTTSSTELDLLLERCEHSENFHGVKMLYCIANIEQIPSDVQFHLVDALRNLRTRSKTFFLALVCRGTKNHPFIDDFNDCVANVLPATDKSVESILMNKCPNVFFVTSNTAGLGKTSFIQKEAHRLRKQLVTLHVSGKLLKETLIGRLLALQLTDMHVLHIDIGNVEDPVELDTFLFELIVLRYVSTRRSSVCLNTDTVYLEIANSMKGILKNLLTNAMLFRRLNLEWQGFSNFIISKEVNSAVQIVCSYLHNLERGNLDKRDLLLEKSDSVKPLRSVRCRELLSKHLQNKKELSYPVVNTFVNVLADQLKKMSHSPFFRIARLIDMVGHKTKLTVKSTLVKEMIEIALEFGTRSVSNCRKTQMSTVSMERSELSESESDKSNIAVNLVQQIDGMIRWESSNHLMFVFHNQNIQTISAIYRDIGKVPLHIKNLFESQIKKSLQDFRKMNETELQGILQKISRTNPFPLPDKKLQEMAREYALTPDNLLKMILIMLRVKANVPVIIMGETGCGKTSLIRYLAKICEVPFDVMNIHAGVTEEAILKKIETSNSKAKDSLNEQWLFFDEINTSENIGLLSDIICHHMFLGKPLAPNLKLLGACNPYKLRTNEAISTAGLDGKIKTDELSRLVYRVLPLPEMMVDYVWDFGSLSEKDEELYISHMVGSIFSDRKLHTLFTAMLSTSQAFVRTKESIEYAVSLRDVQRCKILVEWFMTNLPNKPLLDKSSKSSKLSNELRSIVLALAHCYHSRFSKKEIRKEYRLQMAGILKLHNLNIDYSEDFIYNIIKEEQKDILSRMELPEGTARNTALQENVFVILVCIYSQIPIFVVGKPGCSKSLAMQLIRSNLRGKDSKDNFFKTLPQLYCVSFQGSESSTSDGILKVFEKAENYQRSNSKDDVLSVVILDEIGLAEVSRFNPLKVLHNLLEPDGQSRPNVAVVGISNWALDASKMNRAIHLSRTDMGVVELYETAISISDSFMEKTNKHTALFDINRRDLQTTTADIEKDLREIADAYYSYIKQLRFKNFHGLRDYYSLVKYVAANLAKDSSHSLSNENKASMIIRGLERNFGGLPAEQQILHDVFRNVIAKDNIILQRKMQTKVIDLVAENIQDPLARHLMLITTGESVLGIIEKKLCTIKRDRKEIIFGSQFEEDLTDDYNYRILSRIILCMEEGVVLILKDLDYIYGSLYDMLNQNYTFLGKRKNCRVALGPYSNPICRVSESFRCIVLVDENKLDKSDPPFLNRFEKQNLGFMDTLDKDMLDLIALIDNWIDELGSVAGKQFSMTDLFPLYNEDLIASLVLKLDIKLCHSEFLVSDGDIAVEKCKNELLWIAKPEAIVRLSNSTSSKIRNELEKIEQHYFSLPVHQGLETLFRYLLENSRGHNLTIVFTNSNVHKKFLQGNDMNVQIEKLSTFKSEKQLSGRIGHFWQESDSQILIIQCIGVDDDKHLMLTKSLVEKYRNEYLMKTPAYSKSVYMIIHIDRSRNTCNTVSQLNFLSEWKLVMLDSLECPKRSLESLCQMTFIDTLHTMKPLYQFLEPEIFWAFTRIKYGLYGRSVKSITGIVEKLEQSPEFAAFLEDEVLKWINKHVTADQNNNWQAKVACDITALSTSSSFLEALELHILNTIKIPLSKIMYQLETISILDSFFTEDSSTVERRSVWMSKVQNSNLFSIKHIPDSFGPECYSCDTPDYALKMPFSRYIYNAVESTKDDFLETMNSLRVNCCLDNDEDLPNELFAEALSQHDHFILQKIPDLLTFTYKSWMLDYIDDFCNLASWTICPTIPKERRTKIMKWLVRHKADHQSDDPFQFIIRLHTTCWAHLHLFTSEMHLLEMCWGFDEHMDDILEQISEYLQQPKYNNLQKTNLVTSQTIVDNTERREIYSLSDLREIDTQSRKTEESLTERQDITLSKLGLKLSEQDLTSQNMTDENIDSCEFLDEDCDEQILVISNMSTSNHSIAEGEIIEQKQLLQVKEEMEVKKKQNTDMPSCLNNDLPVEESTENVDIHCTSSEVREIDTSFDEKEQLFIYKSTNPNSVNERDILTNRVMANVPVAISEKDVKTSNLEITDRMSKKQHCKFNELLESVNKNMTPADALVFVICHWMLPDQETLDHAGGVEQWERRVSSILNIAFHISREPQLLFALRMCGEIASALVIPLGLEEKCISNLGTLLQEGYHLDSEEMFKCISQLFETAKESKSMDFDIVHVCQQILSSYVVRCISADPETNAMEFLYRLVKDGDIFSTNMHTFKAPILLSLQVEEEDILMQILEAETDSQDLYSQNKLISSLDSTLTYLCNVGRCDEPFVLLLVDILQDTFTKMFKQNSLIIESDQWEQLIYQSHKVIVMEPFGIRFVTAIAYLKACIPCLVNILNNGNEDQITRGKNTLNVVLSEISVKDVASQLVLYYFKLLSYSNSFGRLNKYCAAEENSKRFPFKVNWTETYAQNCLESCPLCLYVQDEVHKNYSLCLLHDTGDVDGLKKKIVSLKETSFLKTNMYIFLVTFAIKQFYHPTSFMALNDTKRSLMKIFINEAKSCIYLDKQNKFLECVAGEKDFNVPEFILGDSLSHTHCCKVYFLVSLYALILAQLDPEKEESSILMKCLTTPKHIEELFLPGFPETKSVTMPNKYDTHDRSYSNCKCGHRIFLNVSESVQTCVVCNTMLTVKRKENTTKVNSPLISEPGFVQSVETSELTVGIRNLSSIAVNCLQLLVKGCLLGSLAIGFSSVHILEEVTGISEIDVPSTLWKQVSKHWDNISKLLNVDDSTLGIMLHGMQLKMFNHLFLNTCPLKTHDQQQIWEDVFQKELNSEMNERFHTVQRLIHHYDKLHAFTDGIIEHKVLEVDNISLLCSETRTATMPLLFRINALPSKDNFISELYTRRCDFPFLSLIIQNETDLKLTQHIFNILQWHSLTVANLNYMMIKHECLQMPVEDFLHFKKAVMKKDVMKKCFDSFKNSWKCLKESWKGQVLGEKMTFVSYGTRMSELLILGKSSIVFEVLETLIKIQNHFLDKTLEMVSVCEAVHFLSRGKGTAVIQSMQITSVKAEHLIDGNIDWMSLLERESQCELSYGYGRNIQYDFTSIEKNLAVKLLSGKCFIEYENMLPHIVFLDEVYLNYSTMVEELKTGTRQEGLLTEIVNGIKKKKAEDCRMATELLNHIGIVMTLLKKTRGDPELPLVDYVCQWKNILNREFPRHLLPHPESSIKLCHIVALSELLEELCSESVRDGLSNEFREELDSSIQEKLDHIIKVEKLLTIVIKALKRFTYRCLQSNTATDSGRPLQHYLSDVSFWPDNSIEDSCLSIDGKQYRLSDIFPEGLMVRHIFACLTMLEAELEKKQQRSMQMNAFATSFHAKAKTNTETRIVQKKRKATAFRNY